jgi:hypothetical protein
MESLNGKLRWWCRYFKMDSVALKDLIIYHSSSDVEEVNDGLLFLSFMPCLVFAYIILYILCVDFSKEGEALRCKIGPTLY